MQSERRATVLLGAVVGLLLAAALLGPAVVAGGLPARGDLADFFWPMKSYTAARWAAGSLALWNPLSGCGEPWLAQLQTGVLYPGDLPFLLPWPTGPYLGIALHLAIAAAGMAALLWDLGSSRAAAVASAAVFAGGGAFLSLVPVFNNACTAAWLPWVLLGARRLAEGRGSLAALAVPAALSFLAGEPSLAAVGLVSAAAVAFVSRGEGSLAPRPAAAPAARRLGGAALLAAGLVAVVALPFAEHVRRTGRLSTVTREEALARPVGASDLVDLALPPSAAATRAATPGRGGYLVTLALGPAVLFLALAGGAGLPGRPRFLLVLAAVALAGLLLSLGARGGLAPALFDLGLSRGIRYPARWFVFFHLFVALLAGSGLDGWVHGKAAGRTARAAGLGAAAFACVLAALALFPPEGAPARDARRLGIAWGAAAVAAAAVAATRWTKLCPPAAARALLGIAVAVPLPLLAADPLEAVPASDLRPGVREALGLPDSPAGGRVFAVASDISILSRYTLGTEARWTPEVPARAARALAGYGNLREGIPAANSGSPLDDPRRIRLLGAALSGGNPTALLRLANVRHVVTPFPSSLPGAVLGRAALGMRRYDLPEPSGRLFFARAVREAGDEEVFAALKRPDFDPDVAWVAPEGPPVPPLREGKGFSAARITRDEPESLEALVTASSQAFLVVTRSHHPGWRATLDGREVPLRRVDLALTGLPVPPGEHRLELRFAPRSLRAGAAVSLLALAVLLGTWLSGPARPGADA
ncbi:MAG: hypothetical protein EDX89_22870 [Acidobacteria bacterium]|nr:MAG: hypothetical protein EDX89_22870 [Acidobacteriota bacterium]